MGRLFWSFDRAMKADCLAIILAVDGQADFLQGLFGSAEKTAPEPKELPPLTPAALLSMGPHGVLRA
jgi:hypothetical protein